MKETAYIGNNIQLINKFKKIEQFKKFSDADIRSFLEFAKLREYDPGEVIISEGEIDCWIYFLINGKLEIIKESKTISYLENTGELFGEMAIISSSPRSATVRAGDTKTLVLGVDSSTVDRKLREKDLSLSHTVYRMFADILTIRLKRVTEDNMKLMDENLKLKDRLRSSKK